MDKPGTVGNAPAKGTKFRSAVVKSARNQGTKLRKRDYRYVRFY